MSTRAAYETPTLAHPLSGEVIRDDDLPAIKEAVEDLEQYLDRPEVKRMWEMRRKLSKRLVELEPDVVLPGWLAQTETQRKVQRCPRCREILPAEVGGGHGAQGDPETNAGESLDELVVHSETPAATSSESEPVPQPEPQVGADPARGADGLDSAGPESSGSEDSEGGARSTAHVVGDDRGLTPPSESQTELLPTGQRTAEQEAALGVDIFGAPADPEPESPPQGTSSAQDTEEGEADGSSPSSPLDDPIIAQAGAVQIVRGRMQGLTVAQAVEKDPEACVKFANSPEGDQRLKATITTFLYAVRPDLMKETT